MEKKNVFIQIGDVYDGFMLVMVGLEVDKDGGNQIPIGKFINIEGHDAGNRWSDTPVKLALKSKWGIDSKDIEGMSDSFPSKKYNITLTPTYEKPPVVDLVRFIRPRTKNGVIDNMRGVTLLISLNYHEKTIRVDYSICDGDNFDKKFGVKSARIASEKRRPIVMSMPNDGKIPSSGVVSYVMDHLLEINSFAPYPVNSPIYRIIDAWMTR